MPKRHRRKHFKPRVRTSSQSSVEIQVTENEAIISTTTTTTATLTAGQVANPAPPSTYPAMVRVRPEFLNILRLVGAAGAPSAYGELFTVKQVGLYLKEYIKVQKLWDVYNPQIAHCAGDPLEVVFGVKSFTPADANKLLLKNVQPLEPSSMKKWNLSSTVSLQSPLLSEKCTSTPKNKINQHVSSRTSSSTCTEVTARRSNSSSTVQSEENNHAEDSSVQKGNVIKHDVMPGTKVSSAHKNPVRPGAPSAAGSASVSALSSEQQPNPGCQPDRTSADVTMAATRNMDTSGKPPTGQLRQKRKRSISIMTFHASPSSGSSGHRSVDSYEKGPPAKTSPSTSSNSTHSGDKKPETASSPQHKKRKKKAKKKKRTKLEKHTSSDSVESRPQEGAAGVDDPSKEPPEVVPPRKHKSSISIMYSDNDAPTGSYPWFFQVEVQDSDQTEILSIQSKETAVVQSSSDDMWFLEEEIAVEMDDDGLSVEYQYSDPPPFDVEYEVQSDDDIDGDAGTAGAGAAGAEDVSGDGICRDGEDENRSESSEEEILVVCNDSDMEFWADSESSDAESDSFSSDQELTEDDKWLCEQCNTRNRPLRRYCDRCCQIRPGWLPGRKTRRARDALSVLHPSNSAGGRTPSTETDDDQVERRLKVGAPSILSAGNSMSQDACVTSTSAECLAPGENERDAGQSEGITSPVHPAGSAGETPMSTVDHQEACVMMTQEVQHGIHTSSPQTSFSQDMRTLSDADTIPIADLQYQNFLLQDADDEVETPKQAETNISVDSQFSLDEGQRSAQSSFSSSLYFLPDDHQAKSKCILQQMHGSSLDDSGIAASQMIHTDSGIGMTHSSSQDSGCTDVTPSGSFVNDSLTSCDMSGNQPVKPSSEHITFVQKNWRPGSIFSESKRETYLPVRTCLSNFQVTSSAAQASPAFTSIPVTMTTTSSVSISSPTTLSASSSAVKQPHSPPATAVIAAPSVDVAPGATTSENRSVCSICMSGPKEASIVHGDTGHQMCCYSCAMNLYRCRKPCPICRRPIDSVIRNYFV